MIFSEANKSFLLSSEFNLAFKFELHPFEFIRMRCLAVLACEVMLVDEVRVLSQKNIILSYNHRKDINKLKTDRKQC